MSSRSYEFSVVIAVYQVAKYLEETIESVVAQTIGFEENIQLVLVDDGSSDGSESICLRFAQRFPDNVAYIRQDNAGVSAARNRGMQAAAGTYVNFLDGDDVWESEAFEKVAAFFGEHPDVNVVAARQMFFGARTGEHPLNFRFDGDRVIDITTEHNAPQLSVTSAFVRRSALAGREFHSKLTVAEDSRLLLPIIAEDGVYGAMGDVTHWYRRRDEGDSSINRAHQSRSWYFDTPRYGYQELLDYSREKFGCVLPFIQHAVMYDLQWRLRGKLSLELTPDEIAEHRALIAGLIGQIDDDVIFAQCRRTVDHMLYAFSLKEGVSVSKLRSGLRIEKGGVYHRDLKIWNLAKQQRMVIEFIEFEDDTLRVEGHVDAVIERSAVRPEFSVAGQRIEARLIDRPERRQHSLGDVISEPVGFLAEIPLRESQNVTARLGLRDFEMAPALNFGIHARLTPAMKTSYFTADGWFATLGKKRSIIHVRRDTRPFAEMRRERRYLSELVTVAGRSDLAWQRALYFIAKPLLFGRRVWVVSDRIVSARDNGEAFFKYLQRHRSWAVLPYFAVSKDSPDFPALKRIGRVVPYESAKYRLLMLLADAVVSSAADNHTTSPYGADDKLMKNLYSFKFAFLQHGISKDDMSAWLNRYRKNIKVFVTSTVAERESILQARYYYDEKAVKLTGLPRFDELQRGGTANAKKIVFMPTWRKALTGPEDRATGLRKPFPGFSESEYCRFYNALINDPRLLAAMVAKGYTGTFATHPCIVQDAALFEGNETISVDSNCDYDREFKTASLMVTDYSSVAFDFASLGKPVIYTQFDGDDFYRGQIYDVGYFCYEKDGFGPVCTDYEQTVSAIIDAVEDGCEMREPYRGRAAAAFYDRASSSCEAVYRAILEA